MSKSKPKHDWPHIILQQQKSGLSINHFCVQNKISASSFYLHKQREAKSGFVEATVTRQVTEQVCNITTVPQMITLTSLAGELSFPETVCPAFLIKVIKGLS